ncbi:MAG: hypothetical protein Q8O90_07160, partial [Elusimicrobiota bacterium]|nr:hypothetical protein [Elusimicrobiota bacterium]
MPGILFGSAAFLGSFLLFQLELLAGQIVLPHYGGSYYVWTVCLLFYQAALVGGYAYALLLSERLAPKVLLRLHLTLLAASLALMPAFFPAQAFSSPVPDLLWRLALFIAFPFLLLSASTTLCHKLLSDASGKSAFGVFAWSNAGSLAGMFSYSLLVEPALPLASAALLWRGLFALYALLFAAALRLGFHKSPARAGAEAAGEKPRYFLWAVLPAGSAALLAAVTSYQSSATASMPLTWMIPLTAYQLSYAVLFSGLELRVNTLRLFLFSLLFVLAGLLWHFESSLTTIL